MKSVIPSGDFAPLDSGISEPDHKNMISDSDNAPDPNLFRGNLDLILLSVLEDGEKYGLEITKEVNARTDGFFRLNAGSLYPALHRMEKSGFVCAEERQPPRGGSPVRYYRLTETGQKHLEAKRRAYQAFHGAMKSLWR